ncbi:MAG: methionine synthase [Candidatus Handelsmanbacteria bacterium RIFCSPLOWO2_12_FULL_64_10]|uniref:Methionine synthase n=1 Tax=Handelsmanbacteria sp. (strain RIFCSPLOWO2_12_FULL_64_10) TaxID=1817868 RepID=A0A1F6CBU7_HANXR|nr:MAG: methionine synthase [Candidatus Handelsmanbacteria bacterium RIFCSPLOWO2_12_FULL_64_10]
MNRPDRTRLLKELLQEKILVFDGAMGTAIQAQSLTAEDFGGPDLEGCNENLVLTRPDVVLDIHRSYLDAGADVIQTDTFGGTAIVLTEYGLQDRVHEINETAARLARRAADEHVTSDRPRFVYGSMGPTTRAITVTGGVTFDELIRAYHDQAAGLVAGGVDLLFMETCQDTRNVKAGLIGIRQLFDELGLSVPVMVSGTIEPMGTMLAGQGVEAFATSLAHADLFAIGLNCATGPEFMTDHIRSLSALTDRPVSCLPNAGLPDEEGRYRETPESLAAALDRFVRDGWLNLVGGCCGTTPAHIRAIAQMAGGRRPRIPASQRRTLFSGIDFVEASDDQRPLIVGERTNEVGSRKFKRLITEEKYEEASEIARQQVRGGAHILDVNLQNADRDELRDIDLFYEKLIRKVKAPIMIDTTDPIAVERALRYCQGKSIINSVNLEDGPEKFERIAPLARRYGAALIVGCIDEDRQQAQAITRERKLQIAKRSHKLLTEDFGISPEDILFDPLVFPCATGDRNYVGSAVETIEGIRLIKQELPDTKTILGISNVSFGLPDAGRETLNSVFLYHCTKAGLDLAIVNSEKLERYASIPEEERRLAEDLLYNRGDDPVAAFAAHFRTAKSRAPKNAQALPLDQRLANYIIEGSRDGLISDLDRKLREARPLDIINGPLMAGMEEVGRLFNNNELIVAEVLQSAEAMKAAVSHLERFMEKSETSVRGKILLATVKGDVHDIGKNLVDIILSNNGYTVINLGIKVPPETLIQAAHEHAPDAIGLSGLLVKSAQQMAVTAGDLKEAGISLPLLVGGAALSDRFTRTKIAPAYAATVAYAKDAMEGLDLLNRLMDPDARARLEAELQKRDRTLTAPKPTPQEAPVATRRSNSISLDLPIPPAPDLDRHVLDLANLDDVWSYINPQMLYGRHMGLKGRLPELLAAGDKKAVELEKNVEKVKAECRAGHMRAVVVYQFFEAEPDGNRIHLYAGRGASTPVHTFEFPRERRPDGRCLSDLVLPPVGDARDHIALFVTTAGEGIRELAEEAKQKGEYFRSHALQALALETAEAAAEWLHARLRAAWGFPDPEDLPRQGLFQARYRGKRYSFGYPACPDLESQAGLFQLLRPEEIGVQLTEGFMMDPEASVSALVFHHPDATYFSVGA